MVDYFALALTHALLALAAWRLVQRADLDHDPAEDDAKPGGPPDRGPDARA
ncbi:MAG: hypothetical protein KKA12_10035 [Alphaproteobacteria bacterium]|nr:hypothetical protein [Alphaproteobacteria bacterium]